METNSARMGGIRPFQSESAKVRVTAEPDVWRFTSLCQSPSCFPNRPTPRALATIPKA